MFLISQQNNIYYLSTNLNFKLQKKHLMRNMSLLNSATNRRCKFGEIVDRAALITSLIVLRRSLLLFFFCVVTVKNSNSHK